MLKILKRSLTCGIVTLESWKKPIRGYQIVGKPQVDTSLCTGCQSCIKECPAGAIECSEQGALRFRLDQCIFCSQCEDICPESAITMTNEFALADKDRNTLHGETIMIEEQDISSRVYEKLGEQMKDTLKKILGRSLSIYTVNTGSCNACDGEIGALNGCYMDMERFGLCFIASPSHADLLLVTGPVTRNMELPLKQVYQALPYPKLVVAAGACACSGGIFRDSYAAGNTLDAILPVDVYIPGCPPRPQAVLYGILHAIGRSK